MTDLEYDVLDELYFVTSFPDLKHTTDLEASELKKVLMDLYKKGWIKVFESMETETEIAEETLVRKAENFFFLASKQGLLVHNTQ